MRKQAQSFNIAEYLELPKRILVNSPYPDQQFRQDGAITHTMSTAMTWLKARFFQQLMLHRATVRWPARSADVSLLD